MARAKRTDRSEARRAYRERLKEEMEIAAAAAAAAESDEEDEEPAVGVGKMRAARDRGARNGEFTNPVGGRGMIGSAKAAFRQPHYLDDIKFFPKLVLRTAAVWPVFLIVVATVAICLARITKDTTVASDELVNIAVQFVLNPMPMLMPMLAGYLAPRATWLAGALAGGLGALGLVLLMVLTSMKVEGYRHTRGREGAWDHTPVADRRPADRRAVRRGIGLVQALPRRDAGREPATDARLGEQEAGGTFGQDPRAANRRGACRCSRAIARPRAVAGRRPCSATSGSGSMVRATTFTTFDSRWSVPSTKSSAWRRTTPRSRAHASGQRVTLTMPVSSSRARNTVPARRHRMLARDHEPAEPHRAGAAVESEAFVTAPSRSSAGRNSAITWCCASSERTAYESPSRSRSVSGGQIRGGRGRQAQIHGPAGAGRRSRPSGHATPGGRAGTPRSSGALPVERRPRPRPLPAAVRDSPVSGHASRPSPRGAARATRAAAAPASRAPRRGSSARSSPRAARCAPPRRRASRSGRGPARRRAARRAPRRSPSRARGRAGSRSRSPARPSSARATPSTARCSPTITATGRRSIPQPSGSGSPSRPTHSVVVLYVGRVDVHRQDRHAVALGVVDQHLDRVEAHRLRVDQPDRELGRVEELEERRLVGGPGEGGGVALGEAEAREGGDAPEQLLGLLVGQAVGGACSRPRTARAASPSPGSSATSPSPAGTRPTRPPRSPRP